MNISSESTSTIFTFEGQENNFLIYFSAHG